MLLMALYSNTLFLCMCNYVLYDDDVFVLICTDTMAESADLIKHAT